jgi:seryl-tRNA synthetase
MIDPRILTLDPAAVKASLAKRHADDSLLNTVDSIGVLAARRKALISERDELRGQRNTLSKQIGLLYREGKRDEAEQMKTQVQEGNERTKIIETELDEVEAERHALSMTIPNQLHNDVPAGKSDEDNQLLHQWGTPRTDETPAHVEIGEGLGIVDLHRSAKIAGARFSILKGAGARLERALINYFLDLHTTAHGYTEVMVPYIVQRHGFEGTGQLPKFEQDMFKLAEPVNGEDAFLISTAEVPVTNIHREEILEAEELPKKFACFTPCFRSEAGSAGRDVRGLIRQHQFHKVELVWLTTPERAEEDHQSLLSHAETCLQQLELPYRVMLLCGGDTSFAAARCYDLEVWLPSQQQYREISSVSLFTDFQARRMAMRYRPENDGQKKSKPRLAYTLNGSGLAVGRTLVAILENNWQEDGSVVVPKVLRPYVGTDVIRGV